MWKHEAEIKKKVAWKGSSNAMGSPGADWGPGRGQRGCGVCSAPGSGAVGWGALDWIGRGVLSEGDHPASVHVH